MPDITEVEEVVDVTLTGGAGGRVAAEGGGGPVDGT